MSAPSRRTLLVAPLATVPLRAAPAPAAVADAPITATATMAAGSAESCLDLGRRISGLVREEEEARQRGIAVRRRGADPSSFERRAERIADAWIAASDELLLDRRPVTVADVQAKLVAVLDRVNGARWVADEEPCLEAAEGLRQCLLALSALTGVPLRSLAADFFDLELGRRIEGGAA